MPMPITSVPAERRRTAREEKSESDEAITMASASPIMSMAPITSAMSELFLYLVGRMVRLEWMAYFSTGSTQVFSDCAAPYISRRTTVPREAACSKICSAKAGSTFSASINTAIFKR